MWLKLVEQFKKLNYIGFYFPFISDSKSKYSSATLTMMIISYALVVASMFTKKVDGGIAFNTLIATASLYLGRKISGKNDKIEIPDLEAESKEKKDEQV